MCRAYTTLGTQFPSCILAQVFQQQGTPIHVAPVHQCYSSASQPWGCRKREQFFDCSTHVTLVRSVDQLPELRAELAEAACVALDVEWQPGGRKGRAGLGEGPAALLQISVVNKEIYASATKHQPGSAPVQGALGDSVAGQGGAASLGAHSAKTQAVQEALGLQMLRPVKTFVIDLLQFAVRSQPPSAN